MRNANASPLPKRTAIALRPVISTGRTGRVDPMAQREKGRWVWKPKGTQFWQYEFAIRNDRFRGSTGLTVKKEAERFAREERERELGRSARELQARGKLKGKPKDMTFLQAVERYWQEVGQFISNRDNRNSDERAFRRLVDWLGEETMLSDIDHSLCAEIVAKRRGQTFGGKPVSAATVNRQTV